MLWNTSTERQRQEDWPQFEVSFGYRLSPRLYNAGEWDPIWREVLTPKVYIRINEEKIIFNEEIWESYMCVWVCMYEYEYVLMYVWVYVNVYVHVTVYACVWV